MKQPTEAIGVIVMSMRGYGKLFVKDNYFRVKKLLEDWDYSKLYYAGKLHHKRFDKVGLFGKSRRFMVEGWLSMGYAVEQEVRENLKKLEEHRCN